MFCKFCTYPSLSLLFVANGAFSNSIVSIISILSNISCSLIRIVVFRLHWNIFVTYAGIESHIKEWCYGPGGGQTFVVFLGHTKNLGWFILWNKQRPSPFTSFPIHHAQLSFHLTLNNFCMQKVSIIKKKRMGPHPVDAPSEIQSWCL
jgi:hypothetical protein